MSDPSEKPPHRRERIGPILGTIVFFFLAPGTFGFYVPWRLTGWRFGPAFVDGVASRVLGALLALAGLAAVVDSFARFALKGLGTPAPVLPPKRLVVTGLYRHVRNPMYVGLLSLIVGQAVLLGRAVLLAYAMGAWAAVAMFVLLYEEPVLRARYGAEYAAYCAGVRRWWPRRRPWSPPA